MNKVLEASGGEEDSYIAHLQAELEETLSRHEENVGTAHAAERAEAPAKRTWGATGKRGQRRCGAAKKAKTEAAVEQGDSQAPFATGSSKKEKSSAGNREPAVDQEGSQAPLATEGRKKEQSSTGKREPVVDQEGSQAMSACGISKNKSNIGKTEATAELVDSQVPVATGGSKKKKGSKAEPKAKMEASGVVTKRGRAFSWVEQE